MNNFNFLAPIYDNLAQLVFGQTIYEASIYFLDTIAPESKVLVLGGGTGKILPHLRECHIVYVEKSDKMLGQASKRHGIGTVEFIHADFLAWKTDQQFDVVICPFFLDVFSEKNLDLILQKINAVRKANGQLIVADFQDSGRVDQKLLLRVMHLFFGLVSSLESHKLVAIEHRILQRSYFRRCYKTFRNELIFSAVYQHQ